MGRFLGEDYINKKSGQVDLKEKYRIINEAKKAKKAEKKEKYGNENLPVVEIRIPTYWGDELSNGPIRNKYIDLGLPHHQSWIDALERLWRVNKAINAGTYPKGVYEGPVKRKIIRT